VRPIILLALLSLACVNEASAQDAWEAAEHAIRRLPPDSFPGLPDHVEREMNRLECVVPQGSDLAHPHNVVSGRFASPAQVDWAFLCSTGGTSSIHVLWDGEHRCRTGVNPADDRTFLQHLGGESIGYSRRLMPADRDRLTRVAAESEGASLPDVWHQGIEDYFEGKGSTVLVCVDGEWIRWSGID
jgi:hypothetical protein